MHDLYGRIRQRLPGEIRNVLPAEGNGIQEVRLIQGAPVAGIVSGQQVCWGKKPMTAQAIEESLYCLCDHAVPAYESQLAQGYFTAEGCRVGVSGQLRYQEGTIRGFSRIQGLNIRIPYQRAVALPAQVVRYIEEKTTDGILVAGPPGSGKTTFLLALGRHLARTDRRTVVVDEKQELTPLLEEGSPYLMGYPQCRRADGILYGLRGCNPEFILCDEIATREDVEAISQGMGAGVRFLATIHALGMKELEKRFAYRLLQPGCFGMLVLLGETPGSPCKVVMV